MFISQTIKQTGKFVPTIPYPNIRNLLTEGLPSHDLLWARSFGNFQH